MRRVEDVLAFWTQRFFAVGVDSPRLSAELLLAHALGVDRVELLLRRAQIVDAQSLERMEGLALRREQGEPVAYLLGKKEFYGLSLEVSPAVLIPRPETEGLVDLVRRMVPVDYHGWMVDVGTGSGAVTVALASIFPRTSFLAVDICPDALRVAQRNVARHQLLGRVVLVQSDLVDGLRLEGCGVVVANLPYVPRSRPLSHEVASYEPHRALFAGEDGLAAYRRLMPLVHSMPPGGLVVCEIDAVHAAVALTLAPAHACKAWVEADLAGMSRYLVVVF
jgi:release factor glutamine methyltransferase